MNKFYRAKASGLNIGVCAVDKQHAIDLVKWRIREYGIDKAEIVSIKREGTCDWEIGDTVVCGEYQ